MTLPAMTLPAHISQYFAEGALLGAFMVSACCGCALLFHPGSPVHTALGRPVTRRAVMGVLMGLTAVVLVHSPLGRLSGAHMNPSVTLAFAALGKIAPADAAGYVVGQFLGGALGILASRALLRRVIRHPSVHHAATVPGRAGFRGAWLGEFVIALGMMLTVLLASNHAATAPYTAEIAGLLLALYITVEAPLSGTSMNPARTLGSALGARDFRGLWVYFTAPPLGMVCAAGIYSAAFGEAAVYCAKLDHSGDQPCIFRCRIHEMGRRPGIPAVAADVPASGGFSDAP